MIITKRVNISSLFFSFPNTEAVPQKLPETDEKPFFFSPASFLLCFSLSFATVKFAVTVSQSHLKIALF